MYVLLRFIFCFFFSSRRRHTRSLRDWSSDVCSSDLPGAARTLHRRFRAQSTPVAGITFRVVCVASLQRDRDARRRAASQRLACAVHLRNFLRHSLVLDLPQHAVLSVCFVRGKTMRVAVICLLLLTVVFSTAGVASDKPSVPLRPVHTFSIVARDPNTGELGVAVQSHWFSVGSIVTWAEAGVGAVATQSFVDPSYGKNGLDLMRAGKSAPDTLKELLEKDEGREVRQVAMIDAQGRVDAWTGKNDIQAAGHIVGNNFSAQANLMLNDKVWPAMAHAFESTKGDLAERMLAALDAAQAA